MKQKENKCQCNGQVEDNKMKLRTVYLTGPNLHISLSQTIMDANVGFTILGGCHRHNQMQECKVHRGRDILTKPEMHQW